jgi:hypothetical protein
MPGYGPDGEGFRAVEVALDMGCAVVSCSRISPDLQLGIERTG